MNSFLENIRSAQFTFLDLLAEIEREYLYTPAGFRNGNLHNAPDQNQGSAKVLYYAQLKHLNEQDTLLLFAEHYQHVLNNPEDSNHQNIREFIKNGWDGVNFEGVVLTSR